MSRVPTNVRYAKSHEWVRIEANSATVGISDYAQEQLGDIVFVELPEVGAEFAAGEETAVVESVKAASDIYAPVSGVVKAVNSELEGEPERVNGDPYGDGWFFELEASEFDTDDLLDADAYALVCEAEQ